MERRGVLRRTGASVRPDERERFRFFFTLSALVTLAQTVGLAGTEALFLTRAGVEQLPRTFVLASAVTVAGSLAYAFWVGRSRNDRLFEAMLLLAAGGLAAGTGLAWTGSLAVLPALLCAWFLTQAIFINHFWTFVGDYFDTLATKRLFPLFTVGASLGGFVGGLLASGLSGWLPAESLLAGWAAVLAAAALLLRGFRRRLRRWGPLELEEEDETSVEGLRGALRHIRGSALGRWLVLSTLAMVTALLVAQFLYSEILVERFPSERELALFLALFLAASNLVEIAVELWITPALIARLGVGTANLVHPVLTLAAFVLLAIDPHLNAALLARANRELVENATANPVRNLVYNALPLRLRGRVRAFIEGIVMYSGMSIAGVALLAIGTPDLRVLAAVGCVLAVAYLVANGAVRVEYLRTLVAELRGGRLDLAEVSQGIGHLGTGRLESLWRGLLEDEAPPLRLLEQLAPLLVADDVSEPLVHGLTHRRVEVRAICAEALGRVARPAVRASLAAALGDPEARVRRAAVAGLTADDLEIAGLRSAVERLLEDPSPDVRAAAATRAGAHGGSLLQEMLRGDAEEACAALRWLPDSLHARGEELADHSDARIRAAAYLRLAALGRTQALRLGSLRLDVERGDGELRRAALTALAARPDREAAGALAAALGDPLPELRRLVVDALAAHGAECAPVVRLYLRSERERTAEGALQALAASGALESRAVLLGELRHGTRAMWTAVLALRVLARDEALDARFLRRALEDAATRHRRLVFVILGLLENATVVRSVERGLRFGGRRSRSDALEVLSHLGERESARLLVLLFEPGALDPKLDAVAGALRAPATVDEVFEQAAHSGDRWLEAAACSRAVGPAILSPDDMERLLSLGKVPLFARLSLEQLEAVNRICVELTYAPGEVIFREGDPGAELYLLVEGEVDVVKQHGTASQVELNRLGPGGYFGEMAILDGAPRSATIVARRDSRVLKLDGDRLKELILEMPEIAFEILRVLTARLRASDLRYQELARAGGENADPGEAS